MRARSGAWRRVWDMVGFGMANALLVPSVGFDDLPVDDHVPVPAWHLELLAERHAELEANPDGSVPWEQVYAELKADIALSRKAGDP